MEAHINESNSLLMVQNTCLLCDYFMTIQKVRHAQMIKLDSAFEKSAHNESR